MIDALRVFRRGARLVWRHLGWLALASLIWAALSLTIVLLPPAMAGLYTLTNRIAYGEQPRARHALVGGRRYAWLSTQWALVNLAAGGLFYAGLSTDSLSAGWHTALNLTLSVWLAIQFYAWPLLLESPRKRLLPVLRTALLLVIAAPLYTLTMLGTTGLMVLSATAIAEPLALLLASFVTLIGNLAVIERLDAYGRAPDRCSARLD